MNPDITVTEATALALEAAAQITAILKDYEEATGCKIHSVPVDRNATSGTVEARVKVQLP